MGNIDDISLVLGRLTAEVKAMSEKISELERKVDELTGLRKMGVGVIIGFSAISAFFGSKIGSFLAFFNR